MKSLKYIFELLKCHDSMWVNHPNHIEKDSWHRNESLQNSMRIQTFLLNNIIEWEKDERINKSIILILSSHVIYMLSGTLTKRIIRILS